MSAFVFHRELFLWNFIHKVNFPLFWKRRFKEAAISFVAEIVSFLLRSSASSFWKARFLKWPRGGSSENFLSWKGSIRRMRGRRERTKFIRCEKPKERKGWGREGTLEEKPLMSPSPSSMTARMSALNWSPSLSLSLPLFLSFSLCLSTCFSLIYALFFLVNIFADGHFSFLLNLSMISPFSHNSSATDRSRTNSSRLFKSEFSFLQSHDLPFKRWLTRDWFPYLSHFYASRRIPSSSSMSPAGYSPTSHLVRSETLFESSQ